MNNKLELRNWRKQRNISKPKHRVVFANVLKELLEPLYHKDEIPAMVREIMDLYYPEYYPNMLSTVEILDSLTDIRVFAENETENMGYDSELCMSEVIKEISSRKQCPEQKAEWEQYGADGKWLKDKNQDKDTLYKADFSSCKI